MQQNNKRIKENRMDLENCRSAFVPDNLNGKKERVGGERRKEERRVEERGKQGGEG